MTQKKLAAMLGLSAVGLFGLALVVFSGLKQWPMPVTYRLVFLAVFGWVAITSIRLLREERRLRDLAEQPHGADKEMSWSKL